MAVVRGYLEETTSAVVGFDEDSAVVEPWQTEEAGANQTSEFGTETGDTKDFL